MIQRIPLYPFQITVRYRDCPYPLAMIVYAQDDLDALAKARPLRDKPGWTDTRVQPYNPPSLGALVVRKILTAMKLASPKPAITFFDGSGQ